MQALIDGDLVAYRCSASAENEPLDIAIARADKLIRDIIAKTNSDSYICYLTGGNNFRKELCPLYKANRTQVPPKYLQDVREFLVKEWNAKITDGIEADDAMAIAQSDGKYENGHLSYKESTIICSLDKDLLQIPGNHFSWEISGTSHGKQWTRSDTFREVSHLDGLRSFYASTLIGDTSDNIIGVEGIGKAKAPKYFAELDDEREMFQTALALYEERVPGGREQFILNCKLLWLLREEGRIFDEVERELI